MVYAENLSTEAILEGIRNGRTVVKVDGPDGPMLETELSGERMGDTVFADMATLSVVVTGGEGRTLQVIKNAEVIEEIDITSDPFVQEREVVAPEEGEDRYRHQVNEGVRPTTIGGYVWLRMEPSSDTSGSSCGMISAAGYDTGLLLALLALFGWVSRRRRST
jgi:uncharacterized protein (TIGR03382 family)